MDDNRGRDVVNGQPGKWRTISGRRVFIKDGQSLTDAMRESGKFSKEVIDAVDENENDSKKQEVKKERGTASADEFEKILGPEFKGLKGNAAVEKVLSEKKGHVKGAFYRDDIGEIDLFWGDETVGLAHIVMHREAQGIDMQQFSKRITDIVEKGKFGGPAKAPDSFIFRTDEASAVVAYTYRGNDVQYVLTSFMSRGKKK